MHCDSGLVKQLDILRTINTRLTDQSDLWTYGARVSASTTDVTDPLSNGLRHATCSNDEASSNAESEESVDFRFGGCSAVVSVNISHVLIPTLCATIYKL